MQHAHQADVFEAAGDAAVVKNADEVEEHGTADDFAHVAALPSLCRRRPSEKTIETPAIKTNRGKIRSSKWKPSQGACSSCSASQPVKPEGAAFQRDDEFLAPDDQEHVEAARRIERQEAFRCRCRRREGGRLIGHGCKCRILSRMITSRSQALPGNVLCSRLRFPNHRGDRASGVLCSQAEPGNKCFVKTKV